MTLARTHDAATAPRGLLRHVLPIFGYPKMIWQNRYCHDPERFDRHRSTKTFAQQFGMRSQMIHRWIS